MTAAVEPRANLPALTGIRGIAAWFVVLYHIRGAAASQLPPELIATFAKGYLAVDLFFMLSGFVLWLNYGERLRREGLGAAPLFLARRIARIWPLHAFILTGAIALAAVLELTGRNTQGNFPWAELPLHILLVQNWGFTQALTWNDPAWSISCEFAAYLLFPLLALAVDWRRLPTALLLALLVLLVLALGGIFAIAGHDRLGADIPRLGVARALCQFTMGTILCALWARWRDAPGFPFLVSLSLAGALAALALTGQLRETLAVPAFFAAALLALSLTAGSKNNPLGSRPVHYLGEISYATYLVHYLLFVAFKLLFVEDPANVPLPLLGLFLLLTLAASVALYHLVERPAQRALNRALDLARRPRREPAPELG